MQNTYMNDESLASKCIVVPEKLIVNAPKVVKCEVFDIDPESLDANVTTSDDLGRFKACDTHENKRCMNLPD